MLEAGEERTSKPVKGTVGVRREQAGWPVLLVDSSEREDDLCEGVAPHKNTVKQTGR